MTVRDIYYNTYINLLLRLEQYSRTFVVICIDIMDEKIRTCQDHGKNIQFPAISSCHKTDNGPYFAMITRVAIAPPHTGRKPKTEKVGKLGNKIINNMTDRRRNTRIVA